MTNPRAAELQVKLSLAAVTFHSHFTNEREKMRGHSFYLPNNNTKKGSMHTEQVCSVI